MTQAAAEVRMDPRGPRRLNKQGQRISGTYGMLDVARKVPGRHYAWCYRQGVGPHALGAYTAMGYVVEVYHPDGVIAGPHTGSKGHVNQPIEVQDLVLVSCHPEDHADIQRNGEDGNSGLAMIDAISRKLRRTKNPERRGLRPEGPAPDPTFFRFGDMSDEEMA